MHSKRSGRDDGPVSGRVRTSERLCKKSKEYGPQDTTSYEEDMSPQRRRRSESRTRASEKAVRANLRHSMRQRKTSTNLGLYTNSSGTEDIDMMDCNIPLHSDESVPRREGLRPRHGLPFHDNTRNARGQLHSGSDEDDDDDQGTSAERIGQDEVENRNEIEYDDGDDGEGEDEGEDDGDEEEGEGHDVRRRYDLRNRADVHQISIEEDKQRSRSPPCQGMGTNVNRDVRRGGSRIHKRCRLTRAEDSDDDSLLVDELDQSHPIPSLRGGGSRFGPPWLLGGLDIHGTTNWGLNVAASGWGHQSDPFASLTSGIQTAGPSSKGGADIQPVQVDDSVSFDDIGGLSEYIDSLKEMVFFPLLYPDFFASYNITPPRGVLLCGPPGTGKTLIARALASAASKAGQKVSFYMRKGADVLSKWVGEAERQLKLLFEEAQKNQPSIIFFDEIDGLAPVRSSKQEQIHNSIVSTLLALMDGLDSRGQVVLIGATNRVDAIDGALRRPGRFDREFNFPLPGVDARAEILTIHTLKWKKPPSNELKLELAGSCVGYCGADLKALCTEAAIRAFREKYPQVYTSDDKFLIDVDSVTVEKLHFVEAMSTITPAAHRGSFVHSRPLSSVIAPCLQTQLQKAMNILTDIFPVATPLESESARLSMLSHGSLMPLVYRPRFLLCGAEDVGLDHVGPAILHELEKFPVHSLGLPSLLSDPGAKTPEEALVHVFGEARKTTPCIMYLPHFDLWWENAHEQLKAVLLTLLGELPSDSLILLLGTSSVQLDDLPDNAFAVFSSRNIFFVDPPSLEDRSVFFDRLIDSALSIDTEDVTCKSNRIKPLPELPKAPKLAYVPKASEIKAKAERQGHALRRMRMCLRDICNRILYNKRFSAFHYPVNDEDAPNYRAVIQNPMDMAILLQRVDSGCYLTCKHFLEDFELILMNAKKYNGDDYNGARIVSRAYELRDAVHGMLSQMDPALVSFCEKINEEGGPVSVPREFEGLALPQTPIIQTTSLTRSSARLRNVHLSLNLNKCYDVLKKSKKNVDNTELGSTTGEASQSRAPVVPKLCETCTSDCIHQGQQGNLPVECSQTGSCVSSQDVTISDKVETIKQQLVEHTKTYGIPQFERLYTRIMKGVFETKNAVNDEDLRSSILSFLLKFSENEVNF